MEIVNPECLCFCYEFCSSESCLDDTLIQPNITFKHEIYIFGDYILDFDILAIFRSILRRQKRRRHRVGGDVTNCPSDQDPHATNRVARWCRATRNMGGEGGFLAIRDRVCCRFGQRLEIPIFVLQKWRWWVPITIFCCQHSFILHNIVSLGIVIGRWSWISL